MTPIMEIIYIFYVIFSTETIIKNPTKWRNRWKHRYRFLKITSRLNEFMILGLP